MLTQFFHPYFFQLVVVKSTQDYLVEKRGSLSLKLSSYVLLFFLFFLYGHYQSLRIRIIIEPVSCIQQPMSASEVPGSRPKSYMWCFWSDHLSYQILPERLIWSLSFPQRWHGCSTLQVSWESSKDLGLCVRTCSLCVSIPRPGISAYIWWSPM